MTYDIDQLNRLEPAYLAAYGLTEAPFSLQHYDRFLYLTAELNEQLELLKHYTQYGNLLLIVSGERGVGKTSLKQRFIATAQPEWQICEIQAHTMMDASLLLKQVANGFGISEAPLDPQALFEVLSNQLEHLHQQSYEPILIIDDAHELPQDALQSLLYLAEHHSDLQSPLRIILFCEPEIEVMLEDPAIRSLKERVTHSIEINPLTEEQTAEYLRHRLAVAGLDGTSPFTPKLIHKIFHASEGIPAKINEYAHQNLLDDREPLIPEENTYDEEELSKPTYSLKNRIFGAIGLIIIVSALLFQDHINKLFDEAGNNAIETEQVAVTESVNEPAKPEITDEITTTVKPEQTIEFSLNQEETNNIQSSEISNKEITPVEIPQHTENINQAPKKVLLKLSEVNPNPVPASKQRQIISIRGEGFHKRQQVKISWTGNEKILPETQVNITSDTFMNLILNVGTQADTWTVSLSDPLLNIASNTISFKVVATETEITQSPAKTLNQDTHTQLQGHDWIKAQDKNNFTLQLLATHTKNKLPEYLKKHGLNDTAAIFKSQRNGLDWFTLIYGSYPSKSAAQNAVTQLPQGINKPWIRSFTSIQTTLPNDTVSKAIKVKPPLPPVSLTPDSQEGWLWSQDPRHYTLQLAAGTNKTAIEEFISRHNLRSKAVYFHRLRDGKDWYILVYGSYPDVTNARQAINQLPKSLQNVKPWPRSFGAIHAELN